MLRLHFLDIHFNKKREAETLKPLLFYLINHININTMAAIKKVYLSKETFEQDLEICLTILSYPNKKNRYYICRYISAGFYSSIVHIYIN